MTQSSSRRTFLKAAASCVPAAFLAPTVTFAKAPTDKRLLVVILRGGLDGLAAVPAYGDSAYRTQRGPLAVPEPGADDGAHKLDGLFGLHPSLSGFHSLYNKGELAVLHAIASPYRERSHFDGQDVLESGSAGRQKGRDGWLNRALAGFNSETEALAVSQAMPLILSGDQQASSWFPSRVPDADIDYLERVQRLYAEHPVLGPAYEKGRETREMAQSTMDGQGRRRGGQFPALVEPVAKLLSAQDGARIAVMDAGGWDTHANQNGALGFRLRGLDDGIAGFRTAMGPLWEQTAVLLVTEFGRTVAVNGTRGSDHGTGGVAFAAGGAVRGGRILTDWPGLATTDLYEGRDLAPTGDLRSLFKSALVGHMGLDSAFVDRRVFPGSRKAPPVSGLFAGV